MNKTIALYQSASTGAYGKSDITDIYDSLISETGEDCMSAGVVTSILLFANEDHQACHFGSETDCLDYMLSAVSDETNLRREWQNRVYQLEHQVERLQLANKKLIDAQDEKITAEQERRLNITDQYRMANREWLKALGWVEENTGGGTMVMFKDFVCTDGIQRLVGVDGESEDGCLYPVDFDQYFTSDGEYLGDSTDEHPLLHQFQRDEIYTANSTYADCY